MNKKSGSASLIIIIITTFLSLLSMGFWYKTSLLFDIEIQKEKYYKDFYLTESFLNYGIKIAKNNWDKMLDKKFLAKYPIKLKKILDSKIDKSFDGLTLTIIFNRFKINKNYEDKIFILSKLKDKKGKVFNLSCKLTRNDEVSDEQSKFMVQNFTIGDIL